MSARILFTRELIRIGFTRKYEDPDPIVYEKIVRDRRLEIQLWRDGEHRISHWIHSYTEFGRMCTTPTYFKTIPEMYKAIFHELEREDHPHIAPQIIPDENELNVCGQCHSSNLLKLPPQFDNDMHVYRCEDCSCINRVTTTDVKGFDL